MMMTKIGVIIRIALVLSAHSASSSSSYINDEDEPKCIAVDSYSTYICTTDPEASRRVAMSDPDVIVGGEGRGGRDDDDYDYDYDGMMASVLDVDLGVEQRVAGNDMEQSRTRNVLRKMRSYFEDEVLSRSEYEHVRDKW